MIITIIQGGPRAQSQTATVATYLAAELNANPDVSKVEFLDIKNITFRYMVPDPLEKTVSKTSELPFSMRMVSSLFLLNTMDVCQER